MISPMPYSTFVERTVARPGIEIFALFTDLGRVAEVLPEAIASVTVSGTGVGSTRAVKLKPETGYPGTVVERIDALIDQRLFCYSIVGEHPLPLRDYVAVVQFEDLGNGSCRIQYGTNWTPLKGSTVDPGAMLLAFYNAMISGFERL
jgi:Polyketide cyclase / dehydrase and lipid transport